MSISYRRVSRPPDTGHEIRARLNVVLGMAELIADGPLSKDQRRHVEMQQRAGRELLSLIDELFGVTRGAIVPSSHGRAGTEDLTGTRLLLVDDSDESRDLVAGYLAATGVELSVATTGAEAMEASAQQTFDLVLVDVRLPDIDGLELTRRLQHAKGATGAWRLPVVALSADARSTSTTRALASGCSAYLTKPIARSELLLAIRDHRRPASSAPSAALREKFLSRRAREVVTAEEALRCEDFDLLCTLGHNLQGNGVSYGFPRLSDVGRRIEAAARTRKGGVLRELLAELASEVSEGAAALAPRAKVLSGTHRCAPEVTGRHVSVHRRQRST